MAVVRDGVADPVAADAVDDFFVLLGRMRTHFLACCSALDLTSGMGSVLRSLHEPTPMRELARRLGYDPSNFTGIVDRLEQRGLVDRRADPADRRVRQLVLTADGRDLRRDLETRLLDDLPLFAGLDAPERTRLRDLLRRAAAAGAP